MRGIDAEINIMRYKHFCEVLYNAQTENMKIVCKTKVESRKSFAAKKNLFLNYNWWVSRATQFIVSNNNAHERCRMVVNTSA